MTWGPIIHLITLIAANITEVYYITDHCIHHRFWKIIIFTYRNTWLFENRFRVYTIFSYLNYLFWILPLFAVFYRKSFGEFSETFFFSGCGLSSVCLTTPRSITLSGSSRPPITAPCPLLINTTQPHLHMPLLRQRLRHGKRQRKRKDKNWGKII